MAHHNVTTVLPARRLEVVPSGLRTGMAALIVIGVLGFGLSVVLDPQRAWRSYLFNWMFFTGIAQGAVMLSLVTMMAKGLWSRPIRRFALSWGAFLPLGYLMLIPLWLTAPDIFTWYGHVDPPGKAAYLNMPFMVARHVVLLGGLLVLSLVFMRAALRPDVGLVKEGADESLRRLHDRITRGWRGQELEELASHRRIAVLGPIMAFVFAVAWSVVAWDFVMSNEHHWFSTMIGPYVFMGAFLTGVAITALTTIVYAKKDGFAPYFQGSHFHDLGKMTFAFCVFWAYLYFSQFIVIWYGQLPVEQTFFNHRFAPPFRIVSQIVFACVFVIPFFGLMGVTAKKRTGIMAVFASIVLFGMWLERYFLIYPSFYYGEDRLVMGWQEFAPALLFSGLILLSHTWFAQRFPMMQIWQPASEIELDGIEVEVASSSG